MYVNTLQKIGSEEHTNSIPNRAKTFNMMSPEQQFEFIRSDVKSQAHTRILTYAIQIGL